MKFYETPVPLADHFLRHDCLLSHTRYGSTVQAQNAYIVLQVPVSVKHGPAEIVHKKIGAVFGRPAIFRIICAPGVHTIHSI